MTASLTNKWAVDQVIDNAVTIHLGNKVMEYIKLSDGTYAAPPGSATQLIKNADSTYSLKERFGTQMDFNTNKKIAQIKDIDNNTMIFTYNGDNLTTVRDAFNRTLTLTYTSGKLTSVSDSAGRIVQYGYTNAALSGVPKGIRLLCLVLPAAERREEPGTHRSAPHSPRSEAEGGMMI